MCGLFALAVFPVAYYFWGFIRGDGVLTRAAAAEAGHFPENTADLAFLFSQRPPEVPFGETFFHLTYLGFALPILSVVGLLRAKTRKATAVWLAAALVCLVLAAGLTPVWNLQPIALFKDLSPYRLLGAVIPFFAMMEFPYRFFIPLYLFLALAAGTGLAGLPLGRHAKAALACALSVLVICEYILSSGAPSPAPRLKVKPGELIARLRQGSRKEALFDLPFRLELPLVKRYVLGHLHHGRPIVYCSFLNAPVPFSPWLNQQSLINSLLFRASNSGRRAARPSFRNDSTPNNPSC